MTIATKNLLKNTSAIAALGLGLLLVTGCGESGETDDQATMETAQMEADDMATGEMDADEMAGGTLSLEEAAAGALRSEDNKARDQYRHPVETLEFFGIEPDMTVVEIWPGGGWYAEILAPYLAAGGGTYYAAGFEIGDSDYRRQAFDSFREKFADYGDIQYTVLSPGSEGVAPDSSADMVLTFRNIHNWMSGGFADKAFEDFYAALKPGGVLGVVEHRLPADMEMQDGAPSGYVSEAAVREMAEAAGFQFVEASEINANPADTADHPFGVWTLPPTLRKGEYNGASAEEFDTSPYEAIGESDRMTLKFVKPLAGDGAMLE